MPAKPFCDGSTRRDCLRLGTAAAFGLPFTAANLLRAADGPKPTKDASLIFVFLHGGMSTIDTFDMKPDAPPEFRGEFKPIPTEVARPAGLRTPAEDGAGDGQVLADPLVPAPQLGPRPGRPLHAHRLLPGGRVQPDACRRTTRSRRIGSVVSPSKLGPRGSVPPYVCLPKMHPSGGPAYLGAAHAPFVIDGDPSAPNFAVPDLVPPPAVAGRPARRPPQTARRGGPLPALGREPGEPARAVRSRRSAARRST